MAQNFKPARFEAFIAVFVPALVLVTAVSFAYMAWRTPKGGTKVVVLPGIAPHEVVKPPAQSPVVIHAYPANPQAPQTSRPHISNGATEPTPENPITVLPGQNDQPDASNSDEATQTTGNTTEGQNGAAGAPSSQAGQNQEDNQSSAGGSDQTSDPNSGNSTGQ